MPTFINEQELVALVSYFDGQAHNIARNYNLDLDDVHQDIAEVVIVTLPKVPDTSKNVRPYLARSIANHFLLHHSRKYGHVLDTTSIDAPISEHGNDTWSEMLEDTSLNLTPDPDQDRQERKVSALYTALRRLSLDEQERLAGIYGLNAYRPRGERNPRKRLDSSRSTRAYVALRHDEQLATAVGVRS